MIRASGSNAHGPQGSRPFLTPFGGFVVLYATLYSAFGVVSPFLPSFIEARGIPPEQIGILFAAGTAIRLMSAPIAGRVADRTHALRLTLSVCAVASALAALGYLAAWGFAAILAVSLIHAIALAPTTNLADALALVASRRRDAYAFEYGWVRGAGSAAFIVGSIVAGMAVSSYGLTVTIWLQVLLMLAVPVACMLVPAVTTTPPQGHAISRTSVVTLIRLRVFRLVVLAAALVLGSHALHDTFAVIRWSAAGISSRRPACSGRSR